MEKKEEIERIETKKRQLNIDKVDLELNIVSENQATLLTTEQHLLKDLFRADIKPVQSILCVERHQRTEVGYLKPDTIACKWGQSRENATTCGNCPFGVKLAEFVPSNDAKTTLRKLRREHDGAKNLYQ